MKNKLQDTEIKWQIHTNYYFQRPAIRLETTKYALESMSFLAIDPDPRTTELLDQIEPTPLEFYASASTRHKHFCVFELI